MPTGPGAKACAASPMGRESLRGLCVCGPSPIGTAPDSSELTSFAALDGLTVPSLL
jgi:hypothetical protein